MNANVSANSRRRCGAELPIRDPLDSRARNKHRLPLVVVAWRRAAVWPMPIPAPLGRLRHAPAVRPGSAPGPAHDDKCSSQQCGKSGFSLHGGQFVTLPVPSADFLLIMIRGTTSPNRRQKNPVRSVKTEAGFAALLAMSTYHHAQGQARYPGVLLVHGVNGPKGAGMGIGQDGCPPPGNHDKWQTGAIAARLSKRVTGSKLCSAASPGVRRHVGVHAVAIRRSELT